MTTTANTYIIPVKTTQSPDAKPIAVSRNLTTNFTSLINVPKFQVPELIFGGTFVDAPGIAEVISPLLISNKTANTIYVDIQVYRYYDYSTDPATPINDVFSIGKNIPIAGFDTLPFPLNGQFFYNGDVLEAKIDVDYAADATISYTVGQAEEFLEN